MHAKQKTPNQSVNPDLCKRHCAPLAKAGYVKR